MACFMATRHALTSTWLKRLRSAVAVFAAATFCLPGPAIAADEPTPDPVEFNRDIRPIFSDICYKCHGPDKAQRKADLRLDTEAGAFAERDGHRLILPGDTVQSELFRRISSADEDEHMPPVDSGLKLTPRQVELVRRWIEQGARWQPHWSFIPPRRPPLPEVKNKNWAASPIDRFVLARLERDGLAPSPEADRTTLIRRATIDLTGLPPTPAEVDAFLADQSPDAYEKLVDRLLASPRYGERMARPWLDAARYADTSGYQTDGPRVMWRWRDWVIDAFNSNMPFDRFTIEQLAGDLLPGATLDQKIASGFNRNHRINSEGGIIPEEYAVEYVVDRVETTSIVWLGLTMGCARCHDHKYDPLTQREFYQLYAYFNCVPERGRAYKVGNSPPAIKTPTRQQQAALADLDRRLAEAEANYASLEPQIAAAQANWENSLKEKTRGQQAPLQTASPDAAPQPASPTLGWTVTRGLVAQFELDGDAADKTGRSAGGKYVDGQAAFGPGRIGKAAHFDGRSFIDAGNVADFGYFDKFSLAAWIYPEGTAGGTVLSRMQENGVSSGYNVHLQDGKLQVNLVERWLDDSIRVESADALPHDRWVHVLVTYDGSRLASGVKLYLDGASVPLKVVVDELNQTFHSTEPLRIGSSGPGGRFHGSIDDVRAYDVALTAAEALTVATAESIDDILAREPDKRSLQQAHKLRQFFLESQAPARLRDAHRLRIELGEDRQMLWEDVPTTMVMQDVPVPRQAFVLVRGQYDKPGEKVNRGVPATLSPATSAGPAPAPRDRLELARWLVDRANPLTARVAVNRYWQMYFGTGLVKTVDDFGAQGESPSHPELLDWLATRFMDSGWDVKNMQRLIVTSATYRQSSRAAPEALQHDPENRRLARGPRLRLSAEMIRDQALACGGLLVEQLGGPSVKPYQPAGLWKELTDTEDYEPDRGESLFRRSLYTFWKRTVAPPSMMTFDASARETCTVRETRTNTPLQALTLLNETSFVESSRNLAERMIKHGGGSPQERIRFGFRIVLARSPRAAEMTILETDFRHHLDDYRANPDAAKEIAHVGDSPVDEKLDPAELAAYTAVASLILNLDETVTKE